MNKNIISVILFSIFFAGSLAVTSIADVPISALPNGGNAQTTDIVPVVRSGVTMKANPNFQAPITLTTTGNSGASTLTGSTLNIPQYSGGGGSPAFSAITGATNTSAAMVVGTGASLAASGSGTVSATSVPASGISGNIPVTNLNSGTSASSSTFWRGDGIWATPAGGGNVSTSGSPATGNLTKFSGGSTITNADLTGDVTTSGGLAATLATVNSNVGTFQGITVNAKGLVTAASNQSYLTGNQAITLSGDLTGSGTTAIAGTLATVNSNVGSFGSSTSIPNITVDGKGRISAAGGNAVVAPAGTLTGTTLSSNVTASSLTSFGTGIALGTPASGVATNLTGTAAGLTAGTVTTNANLTGAVTSSGNATSLGSFTSAQLSGALTDKTGTGANVFANGPTLIAPALGTPVSGVATNLTGTAAGLTAGNVTTNANLTGPITSTGNATAVTNGAITGPMLANSALSAADQDTSISAWGDSLTYGNQDLKGDSFPGYLQGSTNRFTNNWGFSSLNSATIAARFLNNPQTYNDYTIIWAGRNDALNTPSVTVANIQSMVNALPAGGRYVVLSVLNNQSEPSGSANYNYIIAMNAAIQAAFPNNYLDIRSLLVADYNSGNAADVANHTADIPPVSLRANYGSSGTTTAIMTTSSCSFTLTEPGYTGWYAGDVVLIGSEYIVLTTVTSGGVVSACTRGYGGTTAATYTNGTAITVYDYLHLGGTGYSFVASQVKSFITAHDNLAGVNGSYFPTDTQWNTRIGQQTLLSNTTGFYNTAVGGQALIVNTTGYNNLSLGHFSMWTNTTGHDNVAAGYNALYSNTTGFYNTAFGESALLGSTTGSYNSGFGLFSCYAVAASTQNTCLGSYSGFNTTGSNNTLAGYSAGITVTSGTRNTIIGSNVATTTLQTGSNNILIGTSSATDTPASGSSNEVNIGGLLFWNKNSVAAPAVTSCGTNSIDANANNRSGTVNITAGTPASCTITFAGTGYSTWNHCRVTSQSVNAAFAYSYSLTVLTVTGSALAGKIDYDCDGY